MVNGDILRRLRYTFDFDDHTMITLFKKGGQEVTRADISDWLKKEDDPAYKPLNDRLFAIFLNGYIIEKRGAREGQIPELEKSLTNNLILRKLKIALELKDDDIIQILALADIRASKHEISALFRNPNQSQYRECKDQFLRNFIFGLQKKYRPELEIPKI